MGNSEAQRPMKLLTLKPASCLFFTYTFSSSYMYEENATSCMRNAMRIIRGF